MDRESGDRPETGEEQSGNDSQHLTECEESENNSRKLEYAVKDRSYENAVPEKKKYCMETGNIPVIACMYIVSKLTSGYFGLFEIDGASETVPGIGCHPEDHRGDDKDRKNKKAQGISFFEDRFNLIGAGKERKYFPEDKSEYGKYTERNKSGKI